VDCGESDPAVLEFDHVRTGVTRIADLITRGRPAAEIEAEIACCVVRCANCHRRVTAQRAGWIRVSGRLTDPRLTMRPVRARNLQHIFEALTTSGCVDCGIHELVVLEFDHVGGETCNVSLAWGEVSIERLDAEIRRCEVRCCNCHRRRTATRRRRRAQPPLEDAADERRGARPRASILLPP
jgi:hypothetical protein